MVAPGVPLSAACPEVLRGRGVNGKPRSAEKRGQVDARYLRVKNWGEFQHYKDRFPPWIKLYNKIIGADDQFGFLPELEQWQLVRIWLIASRSSVFTLDEAGNKVPVLPDDELALRRSIQTVKKIPLAKFIRDGWLCPVDASEVLAHDASTDASALLEVEEQRFREVEEPDGFDLALDADQHHQIHEQVNQGLRGVAA